MSIIIIESDGLVLTEMTEAAARNIYTWQYGEGYEMYDFDGTDEELEQVMNGYHFPVYFSDGFNEDDRNFLKNPCGFVSVGPAAQIINKESKKYYDESDDTDIAIGLRPDLCGKGEGLGVRLTGIAVNFAMQEFPDDGVRLMVDESNLRAIKTYEKCEFREVAKFSAMVSIKGKKKKIKFILMVNY